MNDALWGDRRFRTFNVVRGSIVKVWQSKWTSTCRPLFTFAVRRHCSLPHRSAGDNVTNISHVNGNSFGGSFNLRFAAGNSQ